MGQRIAVDKDEYIHLHIPKWFWLCIIVAITIAIGAVLVASIVTVFTGQEWLTAREGHGTAFETGMTIAFISTFAAGFLLILGTIVFAHSIRSKSHPSYRRIWPPWSDETE